MELVHTLAALDELLAKEREELHNIGLVPTMGALHEGHISLVRSCARENDVTVVSIFVNPTQFDDPRDLERYPSDLSGDCELLSTVKGKVVVFAPTVEEMYPEPDTRVFSYPPTDTIMEGRYRPGHFNGVCQIVSKLFDAVKPDSAYFGEKDLQQIAVIRRMVADLGYDIRIVACWTVRDDRLRAISSRHRLLTKGDMRAAEQIYDALHESSIEVGSISVLEMQRLVTKRINSNPRLRVQYCSIVDGDTLRRVRSWWHHGQIVCCVAVVCKESGVRLIDNMRYR